MPRSILTHWQHGPAGSKGTYDHHTRYPGVPIALDVQKRVERNRIVYRKPAELWQEGLPLGNGDLAAMAYQPAGSLCWGMTKSDVRDLRHPVVPWTPHQKMRETFERDRNHMLTDQINEEEWDFRTWFPCFLPAGGLWLSAIDEADLSVKEQTLDLYRAVHTMQLTSGATVESFVYADGNLLAIRVKGMKGKCLRLQLSAEAIEPGKAGDHNSQVAVTIRKEVFRRQLRKWSPTQTTLQTDYADGNRTLLMLQTRGATLQAPVEGSDTATINFDESTAEIFLAVVTARESAFLHRRAGLLLEVAWQRNFDRLAYDHGNFWHERWARSAVQLPERILEALWCFATYTMTASSRGAYPAPLMSAWNLKLDQPYGGDFHNNINSQMCYWPLFASNQADLAEPFLKHFWAVMPEMEMETRRVWNMPGIKVPFASIGRGVDHWGVGYWRYELFVSAWVAQVAWWQYEFSGDRALLERHGWPLIKGVADFYVAYLETDPSTGKLSLPLTKLCEDTMFNVVPSQRLVRDAGTDLTAVHGHLRDAALAADVVGATEDAARYRATLANLNPVPIANGEFSIARGVPLDVPVSHPYQLFPIYPTGLVTQLGPAQMQPIAKRTMANLWRCSSRVTVGQPDKGRLRWNDDLSMGWIGVSLAWMGHGDDALDALLNGWVTSTLKTNGFLTEQSRAPEGRPEMMWMQNQLCGLVNGVNEMLLQSHSGVIQVFPAMPTSWPEVGFVSLRARPGVNVSAKRLGGATRWVTLSSEKSVTIKLRNPWPDEPIANLVAIDPTYDDAPVEFKVDGEGNLLIPLLADRAVLIARSPDVPDETLDQPEDELKEPWSFTGPVRLRSTDPEPDGVWTSWWGKP